MTHIELIPRGHGSCVEDRWEPRENPSIRLQISNRAKQWYGEMALFEFQTDGPKREGRDPRVIEERWATIRWRVIYTPWME